ncbi:large subunit ribosomal protein L31e [Nematocida sp. LUAm3]|nr:large subunit ribosomal protein L31e [Nematocida sp. LUAm3]KAI5174881.1 large subunit ribosomal protein L31e [Nematocida sp. LUAm2]KAI5177521.1 large subunit ribosomal protein L31e [Nematocida sp. LUAm1]
MATISTENKINLITVNLKRLTRGNSKKYWADYAVRNLKKFIKKQLNTEEDVKMDMNLNSAIWSRGRNSLPNKIRVEISRRPSIKDASKMEYLLKNIHVPSFKGLSAERIIIQDQE